MARGDAASVGSLCLARSSKSRAVGVIVGNAPGANSCLALQSVGTSMDMPSEDIAPFDDGPQSETQGETEYADSVEEEGEGEEEDVPEAMT